MSTIIKMNGNSDSAISTTDSIPIAAQQQEQEQQEQQSSRNDENPQSLPPSLEPHSTCRSLPPQPPSQQEDDNDEDNDYDNDAYAETVMNMTLYDPSRWGWTALGGIADVLSPHEVRDILRCIYILCVVLCCVALYLLCFSPRGKQIAFYRFSNLNMSIFISISIPMSMIMSMSMSIVLVFSFFLCDPAITETQYIFCVQKESPENENET